MPSRKATTVILLLLLAVSFAAGNLWHAARRSTIPLKLDAVVQWKEQRQEKHVGADDVLLLNLGDEGIIRVDRHVFEAVAQGQHIRKDAWSTRLEHDASELSLTWSADARGMLLAMPAALVVIALTCWFASRTR